MPKNITTAQKQAPDFSECESDALAQTNEINCLEKNNNIFLNDACFNHTMIIFKLTD